MVEYPDVDLVAERQVRHDFVAVKLFYEGHWQRVPLPWILHHQAQITSAESQAESARIAEATGQITARKAPKETWTAEERATVRPQAWCALSPFSLRQTRPTNPWGSAVFVACAV